MPRILCLLACVILAAHAAALGIPRAVEFASSAGALTLASAQGALPILLDAGDAEALHIAARTFAEDVLRVVGVKPDIFVDALPAGITAAIVVGTIGSALLGRKKPNGAAAKPNGHAQAVLSSVDALEGKWESYDVRVEAGVAGVDEALVIKGSDTRGAIFALYTLSEQIGVSPWYWWADVPATKHDLVAFPRAAALAHGEPTVKYRGFFLNDEQPVLWEWARKQFNIAHGQPPFQAGMYEKVFELLLRLRGNYLWPAMWASMFAVDGSGVVDAVPAAPEMGPNQALAGRMGVVMGTSHHEPMSRNQREFTVSHAAAGASWDYTRSAEWLDAFWRFGAERARGAETVFTVGMRGDGDLPLDGANVKLLEHVTARQQAILKEVYPDKQLKDIPQMWAMYKEVMGYFANGLNVPEEVTALLADDNWGNLMAVLPEGRVSEGGGGIYYHADYVGDPRSYKWTNTVPLAKMWEQLTIADTFNTNKIWICNVGDLKNLETPLEYFMDLGYDLPRWGRDSLLHYLAEKAARDFALDEAGATEAAEIMATYSLLASRRKAELLDSQTYSILSYSEAERVLADWSDLETRARAVHAALGPAYQTPWYEMVLSPVLLNANLNRLYIAAAKSNLYATQARTAANVCARDALDRFEEDNRLTEEYHALEGRKWDNGCLMLVQPHINYQYWQGPMRNSMPPVAFVSAHTGSYPTGQHWGPVHTRFTVEDCAGAWPGDNKHNCPLGYACPDPTLLPMDRHGSARWVDVGSGGTRDVRFEIVADQPWVRASPAKGTITGDGKHDARVRIEVDWDAFDAAPADAAHVEFTCDDGAHMVVTVPLVRAQRPASDWHGAIAGDGYVAIEAGHCVASRAATVDGAEHAWAEIPFYGRTRSGLAVLPPARFDVPAPAAPRATYAFFVAAPPAGAATLTLHIGPSLNFLLGRRLAIGVQLDGGDVRRIEPVPAAPPGELPADWEAVVAAEVREVVADLGDVAQGAHTLTVYGLTAGVVLERVLIDFGGIASRGYSYLGPPESVIV